MTCCTVRGRKFMDKSPDPGRGNLQVQPGFLLKELLALAPRADILDSQLVILTVLAGLVALGGLFLNSPERDYRAMVTPPFWNPSTQVQFSLRTAPRKNSFGI